MSPAGPSLSEVLLHLMTVESGGRAGTSAQAVATGRKLHERLNHAVSPIIGDAGFNALFDRSLKKITAAFIQLDVPKTVGASHTAFSHFCESLEQQELGMIETIIVTLLSTFVSLLSAFIGEGLAWRLLHDTWPDTLPSKRPSGKTP